MMMRDRLTANGATEDLTLSVQLPLENIEYTIEQFLMMRGTRLDTETRLLLSGIRDCVGRVAVSSRRLASAEAPPIPTRTDLKQVV